MNLHICSRITSDGRKVNMDAGNLFPYTMDFYPSEYYDEDYHEQPLIQAEAKINIAELKDLIKQSEKDGSDEVLICFDIDESQARALSYFIKSILKGKIKTTDQ